MAAVKAGGYDLVLIGDSITHTIGELGGKYEPLKAVWEKHFAPRHAINLGHNGYRTENILWNLLSGELEFPRSPKVVMILIGTNNSDDRHFPRVHTPEEIFAGTKAIVELIRRRHPATKILVLRIFPRGGDNEQAVSPPAFNSSAKCIETCRRAGELTAQLADGRQVFWLDVNHVFLRPDGTINTDLMWDLLHPGPAGAEAWVQAVEPMLARLMGDQAIVDPLVNDPTASTWLPAGAPEVSPAPGVDAFLRSLHGNIRLLGCSYAGSKLAASRPFAKGELATASGKWSCAVRTQRVTGDEEALDLTVTFRLSEGVALGAGAAVAFDFIDWSTNNYVLIPASIYSGNRNRIEPRAYAAGLNREDLYHKQLPLTTADLPQLSPEPGQPSKIEVSVCNATTPAMCFFNRRTKRAFILLAEQRTRLGDNGLMIEESRDRSRASFVVSAPCVRERKPEFIGFSASPDRGANWKAGDDVTLRLRVYALASPDIPALLEKFMTVRKAVTGPNEPRDLIPFSEITRLMTRRIDSRFHDGKEFKFYCPENAAWISFGWVGGLMNTFPMLALGDEPRLDRVRRTFDFGIPRAQGRSGYFYGALNHDGKCFGREGYDEHPEIVLTRKNGDVLFWMIKQFMLLKAQGRAAAIKPEWEREIRRLAQAFVDTWHQCGQWGNFLNNQTGEVAVYNTTGGASAIGGLALAAEYFHEPAFLKVAQEAATFYYRRDVVALGMTTGACADILQNADSETAAGFMTSLITLYEITRKSKWLEMSRTLANLTATWVVSYDYRLPPETELARLDAKLAGVVWASTQNKHGAPGSCTSSCDPLFKIYRATGDRRYAELLRDIAHAHAEGIKPGGEITERLTYCDADSRGDRGRGSTGWCELNGALMAMELPGIHARTDTGEVFVFDHVKARVVKRDRNGLTLEIRNPTRCDASVAVLAESARQARQPLGCTAFLKWPRIEVKAGETRIVPISSPKA